MNCQSHHYRGHDPKLITRRWFFEQCGVGLGTIALGSLFRQNGWASPAALANPLASKQPHFPGKAKRVIFLFMAGAPSHLELFDNKPALTKWNGQPPPAELIKDYRAAFINPNAALLGRSSSSPNTARAARSFRNSCPTLPASPTTSPS